MGRTNPARMFLVEVAVVPRLQDGFEVLADEELEDVSCTSQRIVMKLW